MLEAYLKLHHMGLAHCVEAWQDGELAGGLYGVSLGGCFFGESMFARVSNASKAAFIILSRMLQQIGFILIDCQVYTDHLKSLGSEMISRRRYPDILQTSLQQKTRQGSRRPWEEWLPEVIGSTRRSL